MDNGDGTATFPIDSVSGSSDGTVVSVACGTSEKALNIIVFEVDQLEAGTTGSDDTIVPVALISQGNSSIALKTEIEPDGITFPDDYVFQRNSTSNSSLWEDGPALSEDATWSGWSGAGEWSIGIKLGEGNTSAEEVDIYVVDGLQWESDYEDSINDWIVKGVDSFFGVLTLTGDGDSAPSWATDFFTVDLKSPDLGIDSESLTLSDGEFSLNFNTDDVVAASGVNLSTLETTVHLFDNSIDDTMNFTASLLEQIGGLTTHTFTPNETTQISVDISPDVTNATQNVIDKYDSLLSGLEVYDSADSIRAFGTITVSQGIPELTIGTDGTFTAGDAKLRVSQDSTLYQSYQNFQTFEEAYTIVTAYARELGTIPLFNPHATYSSHTGPVQYELEVTPRDATLTFSSVEVNKQSDSLTTQPQYAWLEAVEQTVMEEGRAEFDVTFQSEYGGKTHSAEATLMIEKTNTYELANGDTYSFSQSLHQELIVSLQQDISVHAESHGFSITQINRLTDEFEQDFGNRSTSVANQVSSAFGLAASESGVEKFSIDLGYSYQHTSTVNLVGSWSQTWGTIVNAGVAWEDPDVTTSIDVGYKNNTIVFSNEGLNGQLIFEANAGYNFTVNVLDGGSLSDGGFNYSVNIEINITF